MLKLVIKEVDCSEDLAKGHYSKNQPFNATEVLKISKALCSEPVADLARGSTACTEGCYTRNGEITRERERETERGSETEREREEKRKLGSILQIARSWAPPLNLEP